MNPESKNYLAYIATDIDCCVTDEVLPGYIGTVPDACINFVM